ncbi:hypothetical protein ACIQI8_44000 [Streptomyces sp. NPDC092369]|uniref:hypothetical protein n=1 Tax=Streptomyces sp. NPDC092369 TaxID=3366015 RepID=UPI0038045150
MAAGFGRSGIAVVSLTPVRDAFIDAVAERPQVRTTGRPESKPLLGVRLGAVIRETRTRVTDVLETAPGNADTCFVELRVTDAVLPKRAEGNSPFVLVALVCAMEAGAEQRGSALERAPAVDRRAG